MIICVPCIKIISTLKVLSKLQRFSFSWNKNLRLYASMVGNHLSVKTNWPYHVQKNSNAHAPRPIITYFQTKHDNWNKLYVNETSPQQDQQSFNNPSYISDTVIVNYTQSIPHVLFLSL